MVERALQERLKVLALSIMVIFLFLSGRLWLLQVVRGESFDRLAEGNRVRTVPIRAPRGSIYDRHGRLLAANRLAYTVSVVPSGMSDPEGDVVERLARLLDMRPDEIKAIVEKGGEYPYEPIRIKRDVPIQTVVAVEESRSRLPGILVEEEWVREYPQGALAGHILGYLGLADKEDLASGYNPTDLLGKSGLEDAYEQFLRGEDGYRRVEVNALSRPIRELGTVPPEPGMDLHLTLDLEFQKSVEEALTKGLSRIAQEAEAGMAGAGAAVALDPKTGEILAMASYPPINPSKLAGENRAEYVTTLNNNDLHPWLNRAVRAFPPGSIFKVVTGVAALESGAIGPDTVYNADGHHKYGKRDWSVRSGIAPAGPVTIVEALGRSANDFFWEVALMPEVQGIQGLAAWSRRLGLGEKTGVTMGGAGEMEGLVPDPAWKRAAIGEPWYEAETMDVAIGQGFLQATPLQMAQVYMALANRGIIYKPRLMDHLAAPDQSAAFNVASDVTYRIDAAASTWRAIGEGLRAVVQWRRGTGRTAFIGAEYDPAGKTGTAQTNRAAHGWFAGYAPAADPEIVVTVFAEFGESGARAAPVVRDIMDAYFEDRTGSELDSSR